MSGKKLFLDTNLFIYLVEGESDLSDKVEQIVTFSRQRGITIFTSALTVGEVLVKPVKDGNESLIDRYKDLFNKIEIVSMDAQISYKFAEIRASFTIKAPDAIQLASAIIGGAAHFVTNDERLANVNIGGINIHSLQNALYALR